MEYPGPYHKGLYTREAGRTEREDNVMTETERELKMLPCGSEKGVISQGKQIASGRWKKQGNEFSSRVSRRNTDLPVLVTAI